MATRALILQAMRLFDLAAEALQAIEGFFPSRLHSEGFGTRLTHMFASRLDVQVEPHVPCCPVCSGLAAASDEAFTSDWARTCGRCHPLMR